MIKSITSAALSSQLDSQQHVITAPLGITAFPGLYPSVRMLESGALPSKATYSSPKESYYLFSLFQSINLYSIYSYICPDPLPSLKAGGPVIY